jgi:uncharacterized spore protein YtfJ
MTDQTHERVEVKAPSQLPDPAVPIHAVQMALENLTAAASVEAVYAKPVQNGSSVVIPAAEVLSFAAFGIGYGGGQSEGGKDAGSGSGGGGGGRVLARPVAVIVLSDHGARVEPVVDVTKIALATFTAVGFMFSMWVRMRRRPAR